MTLTSIYTCGNFKDREGKRDTVWRKKRGGNERNGWVQLHSHFNQNQERMKHRLKEAAADTALEEEAREKRSIYVNNIG